MNNITYRIRPKAFDLMQSEPMKFTFENTTFFDVSREVTMELFGPAVNEIVINNSKLDHFTSDLFLNINNKSTILIENCDLKAGSINGINENLEFRLLEIQKLKLKNIEFMNQHIIHPFLNVKLDILEFEHCTNLELDAEDVIKVLAKEVNFRNSSFNLNRSSLPSTFTNYRVSQQVPFIGHISQTT